MSPAWRLLSRLPALAAATVIIASSNPTGAPVHLVIQPATHASTHTCS